MQDQYFNKRISFMADDPQNVRLMRCAVCKIYTNHHRTPSGEWVCWCGNVDHEPTAQESMESRQAEILQAIELGIIEPDSDAFGELAETGIWLEDGSDVNWNQQLYDAGYPGGVY